MILNDLEKIFHRAWRFSFSRVKLFFVFSVLAICGFLAVVFRVISLHSGQWVQMNLTFLPIFISAAILFAMGIALIQMYHCEVKKESIDYLQIWKKTCEHLLGILQLAVPLIFVFLILWMALGIFYLLRAIPLIGDVVGSVLAFGPFLLVLSSIILGFLTLLILFFVTPAAAFQSKMDHLFIKRVFYVLKANGFFALFMLVIGLIPLLFVIGILSLAAVLTHMMYVEAYEGFSLALKWFFIMLPFCAFLTPFAIFFFNFSLESYAFISKRVAPKASEEIET